MIVKRRIFLAGLIAAPVVVRAASLDLVRGIVLPVQKWIWRKGSRIESDSQIGYRGMEEYAFRGLLAEADAAAFGEITPRDQKIIDALGGMVQSHKDPYLSTFEYYIPLNFTRILKPS